MVCATGSIRRRKTSKNVESTSSRYEILALDQPIQNRAFSNVLGGLMNFSALDLAGAVSARASSCLAIGTLAVLGFMVSIGAVGFVVLVFGVGILGLIGACGVLTLAVLVTASVAAILIIGSIFVPAGFFLVGGSFNMTLFSMLIAIVDFLPGCALVAVAFLTLALITAFV